MPLPHTQAIPTSSCQATEKTNLIAPGYRPHETNLDHHQKATRERQFLLTPFPQYTEENTREESPDKTRSEQSPAPSRLPTLTPKDNANS